MKSRAGAALFTLLSTLLVAAPLCAHHAFGAEYDANKTIVLTGAVTKLEWTNPHVRFYVAVKEKDGSTTMWDLELQSPNTLTRQGWTRHTLKAGDQVTVSAYLAKDGSKRANARGSVTLPDGKKIFAGSSAGDGGPDDAK
jgi:outer membrane usher protein FimD/PapC